MNRRAKLLFVVAVFAVFGAFLLLRCLLGLRSAIPPELQSLWIEDFSLDIIREILGESKPDLDGDGKEEKVLLYAHTFTRVFLSVKWSDGRSAEKIGKVIGYDYDVATRVFVTDMDGDGMEEVAAIIPVGKRTTNLAVWKFDTGARKMQMVGKIPFTPVSEWSEGAMQILDVDGDGKKEIVSFCPISSAPRWGFWKTTSLDVQVVWMERGRLQSNRRQFAVHKTVWLFPSLICPVMTGIQSFKAKVVMVGNQRFYVAPFTVSVQRLNLLEIVQSGCIPEENKHYAAIFEIKTVDPSSWQFVGKSVLH